MESNIISQFNLPSYVKGKTFADASKAIDRKFKDRSDKYSEQTKQELLSRLAEAQEYIKQQDEAIKANSTQVPDMMDGQVPEGMGEFAGGGIMAAGFAKNATASDQMGALQGGMGGVEELLNMGNQLFGDTGIDTRSGQMYDDVSKGGSAVSGAMSGAKAGAVLGPWGAAGGAVLGGISGLIGGGRKQQDIEEANMNATVAKTADYRSDFGYGGKMNKYNTGGNLDELFRIKPQAQLELQKQAFGNPLDKVYNRPEATMANVQSEKTDTGLALSRGADWMKENYGNILSYAPIAGNLLELNKLKQAPTAKGTRLDNKYEKQNFDEAALINKVNQNGVNSALKEASGGDMSALRANILAGNVNKTKAISDAMIQADGINRQEGQFQFQSDMQRDQVNANLDERYLDRKDRDTAAYETTKSNLKRSLFEDAGKIGQDVINKKLVRDMFGYTWDGEYFVDPKGKKYTQQEVALMKAQKDKAEKDNKSMYGGYLKNKK